MVGLWSKVGDWMLGALGRATQIEDGLIVPAGGRGRKPDLLIPVIRKPFTVIEGGKRGATRPAQPTPPLTPTRRAS